MVPGLVAPLGPADAQAVRQPSLDQVARAPRAYVGRPLRLGGFVCADTLRGRLICRADHAGGVVTIEAERVGARTRPEVAELLDSACRGGGALAKPECRFDVAFTAGDGSAEGGAGGAGRVVALRAAEIVLERSGPRARR